MYVDSVDDICQKMNDQIIIESVWCEDGREEIEDDGSTSGIADVSPTTKEAIAAIETKSMVILWNCCI